MTKMRQHKTRKNRHESDPKIRESTLNSRVADS